VTNQSAVGSILSNLRYRLVQFGPVSFAIVVLLPVLFMALAVVVPARRETVWVVLAQNGREPKCQRERPENPELDGWIEARPCTTCDDIARLTESRGRVALVLGSDGIPDACQTSQDPYPPGLFQRCFEYGLARVWRDKDEAAPQN
jgi:hypothetical protein